MSTYKAPLTDIRFALYDVLKVEPLFARLGYPDASRDILDAVLDEAARFTENVLAPLNSVGDEVGSTFDPATGEVSTPPGFKAAYRQYMEGGWIGLTASPDFGGQGLPHVLVRFYTNPDGRAARRTTLIVLCLLGGFYLFPTVYGALARVYTPDLLLTGRSLTAAQARRLGLVHAVYPSEHLATATLAFARRLLEGPPEALALSKRLLNLSFDMNYGALSNLEALSQAVSMSTRYHQDCVQQFQAGQTLAYDWDRQEK